MSAVTHPLSAAQQGDARARQELWEVVYRKLRVMAAHKMASEREGHTLQPTALVHEVFLRLAGGDSGAPAWQGRGHFFGAATEAMRRSLVESARRKHRLKRGGDRLPEELDEDHLQHPATDEKILQVHQVLDELATVDPVKAEIVKLRFFVGLKHDEIARLLGVNEKTVRRQWELAKVWLLRAIRSEPGFPGEKS